MDWASVDCDQTVTSFVREGQVPPNEFRPLLAQARPLKIVCLGGGTGMPVVLKGLSDQADPKGRYAGLDITAIVAMSDDGGSSGRLRRSSGLLPAALRARAGTADQVKVLVDRTSFLALEDGWNALVEATRGAPFYRHEFIRIWIDNFAPRGRLRVLLTQDPSGSLTGALPLLEERRRILGFPVRQLSAPANVHSCRFDLIAKEPENAARALLAHLAADRSWDVLQLADVPEGGNAWALFREAERVGFPVAAWESMRSPYIPLPPSMEELERALSAKFRSNLRRRRRKLEALGRVSVERVEGALEVERKLEEGLLLEQAGWKGQSGTAIGQDRRARGFYSELARSAAHRGYLSLFFLRLEGQPVAFQYALSSRDRYFLLKPSYLERLGDCSPGQLLVREVLRDCIGRGMTEFDFLGPNMVWKQDWTKHERRHTWLLVFRDSAWGRALCRARFNWIPRAKRIWQQWTR